jgi:hypothetical protein
MSLNGEMSDPDSLSSRVQYQYLTPRALSVTITTFGYRVIHGAWISPLPGRLFAKAHQSPGPSTTVGPTQEWKEVKKCRVRRPIDDLHHRNWYQIEFSDVFEVAY